MVPISRVIAPFAQFFNGDGTPLENGWLKFLNSNSNNSLKNTYADADQSIANANPLQLDADGRCPNVFGEGVYRIELYTNNPVTHLPGALIQQFDPVYAEYLIEGAGGNFAEWDTDESYQVGSIVVYNGKYYRSFTSNNQGNMPDTATDEWEQIAFLRYWNADVTYLTDDVVISGSQLYFSLADANTGNVPLTSPAWWDPVGSGTTLLNWSESGTTFQPNATGYDLGSASNIVGDAWINYLGQFTFTPSSLPTLDYHIANKIYVDETAALRMRWIGDWTPATYEINDVVRDDNWTMVAISQTSDRPAPQPAGDNLWVRDAFSPPAFSETSDSQPALFIGQRYEFTPAFTVRSIRVWLPSASIGDDVEVWMVYNSTTDPRIVNVLPPLTIGADQVEKWVTLTIGSQYVASGSFIDFIMVLRPGTGPLTFTYEWDYSRTNGDPSSGQIYHQGGLNADQIRVHEEDSSATDRTADLNNIVAGSKITMDSQDYTWEVLQASKTGDIYTFIVDPGARAGAETSDFTFTYYAATPIYFVYNTDLYLSDSRISGYYATEYDPSNATYLNNNGYGIDIEVQNMISSDDWEVVAAPFGTVSGGTGSELVNWEESDTVLRPVDSGAGQLGDSSHLISGIYLDDDAVASFGSAGSFNIFYYTTNTSGRIQSTSLLELVTTSSVSITFATSATDRWGIDGTGEFLPATDSTYSIGADATRVLKVWADDIESTNVPTIAGGSFIDAAVPDQSSSAGYFLTTDGSNVSWAAVSLVNWEESGTTFQPKVSGYDLGSTTNLLGDAYFGDSGVINLGADQDGSVFHSGTNMFITGNTGSIYFNSVLGNLYFRTATVNRWIISDSALYPNSANSYTLGTTTREISDVYAINYYAGTTQEMLLYHDGSGNGYVSVSTADFLFLADADKWAITPAGHLVPVTTGTYNVGSTSNRILTFYAVNALNTSDIRFKTNIRENPFGLDFISRLNTSVFRLKEIDCKRYRCGMIAQQVNEVLSDLGYTYDDFTGTHYDEEEDRWDMNYTEFIAPLIKAVQELKYKVEVLEAAA